MQAHRDPNVVGRVKNFAASGKKPLHKTEPIRVYPQSKRIFRNVVSEFLDVFLPVGFQIEIGIPLKVGVEDGDTLKTRHAIGTQFSVSPGEQIPETALVDEAVRL